MKIILRWLGVLPAALIAPIVGCFVICILLLIGDFLSGHFWLYMRHPEILPIEHFFTSFVVFGAFGGLFVSAGAIVAPSHNRIVAFALFAVIAICFGFLLILTLLMSDFSHSWRMLINILVCIFAAAGTAFSIEDEQLI